MKNHLIFDVSPALPAGMSLDRRKGSITGIPSIATEKFVYTITQRSIRGQPCLCVEDDDTSPCCSVCLGPMVENNGASIQLQCTHRFHVHCIELWLQKHRSCPCCRSPVLDGGTLAGTRTTPTRERLKKTKIAFAVADDWQASHPRAWQAAMCQVWLQDKLQMSEDDRCHLLRLDGSQLVRLLSPEAVASRFPMVQPASRVLIAKSVRELLSKYDAQEEPGQVLSPTG